MTAPIEIIAHRGANREAPENTLAAFDKALAAGVDGIELDIQFTGDGVPIVHHDPAISGRSISSLTAAEVQALRPAPSLVDVLERVAGRCRLYVEIKAPAATEAVVRQLTPHSSWCAIHSFDHRVAKQAATLNPAIPVGVLLVSYLIDIRGAMQAASARDVWQQADYIDQLLVETVHRAGGRVIAWTVNDPQRARELISLGVDALCSDVPRDLVAVTGRSSG
jgi:glycerophosphoryl diester phosphodiesterase